MSNRRVAIIDVGTLKSKFEVREYDTNGNYSCMHKDKQLTVLGRELNEGQGTYDLHAYAYYLYEN